MKSDSLQLPNLTQLSAPMVSQAIRAYERNGFRTVRSQVADIGRGFVMDDYVMEKVF